MALRVERDRVVKLTYRILDQDGRVLDNRTPEQAYEYLHGHGQIVAPVERRLEGKTAGFSAEISVSPREAYGDYKPDLVTEVPRSMFPAGIAIQVGMKFSTQGIGGQPMTVRVIEIEADSVTVDGNHPLAGLELIFDLTILDVREATPEEITAGRVNPNHGPSGLVH